MRNARYVAAPAEAQRCRRIVAGNVARMREIAGLARAAHESAAPHCCAPLAHAAPGPPRTQRAGHWGSSGLDKAFSAQPGQATLSSHTYTLQG